MKFDDLSTISCEEYLRRLRIYCRLPQPGKITDKQKRNYRKTILKNPNCFELVSKSCVLILEEDLRKLEDLLSIYIALLDCIFIPYVTLEFCKNVFQYYGLDNKTGIKACALLACTHIQLKNNDSALELIATLETTEERLWDKQTYACLSWKSCLYSNFDKCTNYFYHSNAKHLDTLNPSESNLMLLGNNHPRSNQVLIFTRTYNELELIEVFLNYYRNLGAVHFVVVDNCSTDGTEQFLLAQKDVLLYSSNDSFKESKYGARWHNALASILTIPSRLYLNVDSDEFLVWSGMEHESLNHFLDRLNTIGLDIASGPLIDLIPDNYEKQTNLLNELGIQNIFTTSGFFDPFIDEKGSVYPPYFHHSGGIRERIMGLKPYLTKTPIFRGCESIKYLNSNHTTTPGQSQNLIALLHFKFTPNSINRYVEQIARGEHYFDNGYDRYIELIRQRFSLSLDKVVPYVSSKTLIEHRIIRDAKSSLDCFYGLILEIRQLIIQSKHNKSEASFANIKVTNDLSLFLDSLVEIANLTSVSDSLDLDNLIILLDTLRITFLRIKGYLPQRDKLVACLGLTIGKLLDSSSIIYSDTLCISLSSLVHVFDSPHQIIFFKAFVQDASKNHKSLLALLVKYLNVVDPILTYIYTNLESNNILVRTSTSPDIPSLSDLKFTFSLNKLKLLLANTRRIDPIFQSAELGLPNDIGCEQLLKQSVDTFNRTDSSPDRIKSFIILCLLAKFSLSRSLSLEIYDQI